MRVDGHAVAALDHDAVISILTRAGAQCELVLGPPVAGDNGMTRAATRCVTLRHAHGADIGIDFHAMQVWLTGN